MKNLTLSFLGLLICAMVFAQSPQSFQYQSVVRDGNGDVVVNQPVSFQISLISGSSTGTVEYCETHAATTNAFGLVTLAIGEGTVVSGSFSGINWSTAAHFIKVEVDINGGTAFVDMGTTQLLSVPYALHAKTSEDTFSGNYNDLNGVPTNVSTFTNDAGYVTTSNDADADPANEIQTLSVVGNNLTISGANTVAIPQTTYTAGTGINVTGTTITNTAPNQIVSITGGGATTVTGTYPSYTVSSTDNVNDADSDPANELQVLSVLNDTLYLSNGGFVSLSNYSDTLWRLAGTNIYNTNSGKVGVGTNTPPAKLVVQGDASMADTVPLFEVKDRDGHTVFIVYPDSARFYLGDDGSKTSKGAFAVSGRNTAKQPTHDFLWVTPDSTRIFTGNETSGFGVENIETGGSQRYMKLIPDNYFIGHNSGLNNTTGAFNNYMGYEAGYSNTVGYYNVFLGYTSGRNNIVGSSNTFIGYAAGWNSNGQSNIAVGMNALGNSNTGDYNVAIGNQSLAYNENGNYNVAFGNNALFYNLSGSYNVALGVYALRSNSGGNRNIALGYQSLYNNSSGNENVVLGYNSGYTNTTGSNNVFLGYYSGYTNNASFNVFLGYESGRSNTTGTHNSFIGYLSGRSNNIGNSNVFIGDNAGYSNTNGNYNLAIGQYALYSNTVYGNNIALGYNVLYSNTDGWDNLAIGNASMYYNSSGTSNVAVGEQALYRNTSGGSNVSVGKWAMYYNNGNNNTALGNLAFFSASATAYTNSTALGYGAPMTASNRVCVGNTSVTWIGGQVTWSTYSDARFKKNVNEDVPGLSFITQLRPVTYNYDMDAMAHFFHTPDSLRLPDAERNQAGIKYTGFIAQEVDAIAKNLGYNFSGVCKPENAEDFYSIRYAEFTVPLVKSVQELHTLNIIQGNRIEALETENNNLKLVLEKMQKDIEFLKAK
jgi:hypothetical protein